MTNQVGTIRKKQNPFDLFDANLDMCKAKRVWGYHWLERMKMCPVNVPQQKPNTYPRKRNIPGAITQNVFLVQQARMPTCPMTFKTCQIKTRWTNTNITTNTWRISQMQNQTLAWPTICVWRQTSEFIVLVGFHWWRMHRFVVGGGGGCCCRCVSVHLPTQLYATTKNWKTSRLYSKHQCELTLQKKKYKNN